VAVGVIPSRIAARGAKGLFSGIGQRKQVHRGDRRAGRVRKCLVRIESGGSVMADIFLFAMNIKFLMLVIHDPSVNGLLAAACGYSPSG
jgi:hypothetical protein